MKKYIFIGFILSLSLLACKTSSQVDKAPDVSNLPHALLWEINGEGLEEPSYLFGTIHLITKDAFFWPDGTLAAFEDAESVVFEIDLNDMFDISKQMGLLSQAFMRDGQTLKDLYTPEDYVFVKGHFEDMGIPMFFLERLKPMFLTVFASGDMELGSGLSGNGNMRSYEMELFELSQQSGKEVRGLETIEFQMSVFDSIPYTDQAKMLIETIRSADSEDDAFKQMVSLYTSQNINDMVTAMSEDDGIKGYEDLLLNTRNQNWIPIMSELMKDKSIFFAVGAGHLGGEQGVVNLLTEAGYQLRPLSLND